MNVIKLIEELKTWHPNTEILIDILPAFDNEASNGGDYEWHDFEVMDGDDKQSDATYTILKINPDVMGC